MKSYAPRVVGSEEEEGRAAVVDGVAVEARDPYGFWYIKKPKSEKLSGAYTSLRVLTEDLKKFGKAKEVKAEAETAKA